MSRRHRRAPRSPRTRWCSTAGARKRRAPGAPRTARRSVRASPPRGASARPRWRNQTTTAAPLGATADAAKSARVPWLDSACDGPSRPLGSNATARTLRPRCTTTTPLPSAATPASTAPERMSTRDAPKAPPGAAERRRTPGSVRASARAVGLTTNDRPSRATARAAETSRGAMTCAAGAGAARTSASPMAQPHARVAFTHGEHLARGAGCAAPPGARGVFRSALRAGTRPTAHRGGRRRAVGARVVVLDGVRLRVRTTCALRHLPSAPPPAIPSLD